MPKYSYYDVKRQLRKLKGILISSVLLGFTGVGTIITWRIMSNYWLLIITVILFLIAFFPYPSKERAKRELEKNRQKNLRATNRNRMVILKYFTFKKTAQARNIRQNKILYRIARLLIIAGLLVILVDVSFYRYAATMFRIELIYFGIVLCITSLLGKFRRVFHTYANKNKDISLHRHGKCNQCGACCKLPVRCLFYFNHKCLIYNHRPKSCRIYPTRKSDVIGLNCGYWFDG